MIGIVDYGMGNLLSVQNALEYLGEDVMICSEPNQLKEAEKIILPGVGAFKDCIGNLRQKGFVEVLNEEVLEKKKPILGICLGMQVLATEGTEGGMFEGLGWIEGRVIRLDNKGEKIKIPNIGWENTKYKATSPLFKDLRKEPDFYFVHSFFMDCADESYIDAYYDFCGQKVTASVRKGNIFGTQFHPEKSSDHGRQVLENFIAYN